MPVIPQVLTELARPEVVAVLHVVVAAGVSSHAIMTKDDTKAATGWVGLIWLSPFVGSLLYYFFGINRIRRRASATIGRARMPGEAVAHRLLEKAGGDVATYTPLALLGDRVAGLPLTAGNRIEPLVDGDQAFPAMLREIRAAKATIMLSSYIFDNDDAGREFVAALGEAVARGVDVRVLVDATGSRYTFPSIVPALHRAKVPVARFMPNLSLTRISGFNLRNHRKILVVDGVVGFTGGMNIREANYVRHPLRTTARVQDLHFRISGPVVGHLRQAFVEDWQFTAKEVLAGPRWLPELAPAGETLARGVPDGPDRDFEKTLWTMLGAISLARRRVRILTPYFLPDPATVRFLTVAALAGVEVEIVLPEVSNLRLVQWASMAMVTPLLSRFCKIYVSPPPFDHSKLMLVDDAWALLGSANWDPRSLRLNFEFNIECFSQPLAARLNELFEAKLAAARPLTLEEVRGRRFPVRLRDGVIRLLAPYL